MTGGPPAAGKRMRGLFSRRVVPIIDCPTKMAAASCKQQLPRPLFFLLVLLILQKAIFASVCVDVTL